MGRKRSEGRPVFGLGWGKVVLWAVGFLVFVPAPSLWPQAAPPVVLRYDGAAPIANLRDLITVPSAGALSWREIQRSVRLLYASGYCQQVSVRMLAAMPGNGASRRTLEFFCRLQPWVREVRFDYAGTRTYSARRLRRLIPELEAGRNWDPELVPRWRTTLENFYRQAGFRGPRVDITFQVLDPATKGGVVRVRVHEGRPQDVDRAVWTEPPCLSLRRAVAAALQGVKRWNEGAQRRVQAAVQRLHRWYPLAWVEARWQASDHGGILNLRGACGPRVRVKIRNWPEDNLPELDIGTYFSGLRNWSEEPFRQMAIDLERRLRALGFAEVRVTAKVGPIDTAGYRIRILEVEPGPRNWVAAITWSEPLPDGFRDRVHAWRRGMPWVAARFESWLRVLERDLHLAGYRNSRCSYRADQRDHQVRVRVDCQIAPLQRVQEIHFFGNLTWDDDTLGGLIPLRVGQPFRSEDVQVSREVLTEWYWQHGFFHVAIEPHVTELPGNGGMRVDFRIVEGFQTRVGQIVFRGLRRTHPGVLRRFMALRPGEPLRLDRLEESQQRLYELGIFRRIEPRLPLPQHMEEVQDLVLGFHEAEGMRWNYGVGYQERDQVRGVVTLTHNNLFGRVFQLFGLFRFSFVNRRALVSFGGPYLGPLTMEWRVSVESEFQDRVSFDMVRNRLILQVLHRFRRRRSLTAQFDFSQTRVSDIRLIDPLLIAREFENLRLANLSVNFISDTRDSILNATRGSFMTLSAEVSLRALGSDVTYVKFSGQRTGYWRLMSRWVLAVAVRAGWSRRLAGDPILPISQRFFAGGSRSHRGFSLDNLGPRDVVSGAPIGGNAFWIVNLEQRIFLSQHWGLVLFADLGNVFLEKISFRPAAIREAGGIGIRFQAPIGLVGVDFAWLLDARPGEDRFHWFVTIGQEF